ncbi:MAG: hypothetical protein R2991_11810 [Thermoanaerobaculia bacterium]
MLVHYSGELWELDPVEVCPRPLPPARVHELAPPELAIFQDLSLDPQEIREFLAQRDLALLVVRNATTRDALDRQQPFNLRVPGGEQTLGAGGRIYDISALQIFQADLIRGIGGLDDPAPGRRVLAQPMHDVTGNPPAPGAPAGSVAIAPDGSIAALVPARRALAWQTVAPDRTPVVRERNWLTFQPGEIRACDGCHGVNDLNQAGEPPASNPPEALRALLESLADLPLFSDGFESGDTTRWSATVD